MSRTAAMGMPKLDAGPQKSVRMLIESVFGCPFWGKLGEEHVRVEQK